MPQMSWKSATTTQGGVLHFMGVDPGLSGGVVVLDGNGKVVTSMPMPPTEYDQWVLISTCKKSYPGLFCHIEWITTAIYGAAKSSMAKLYGSYKGLRMALVAAGIPFEEVSPKRWQKEMGMEARKKAEATNKWKARLRAKAQQLFKTVRVTPETADALLIAEHCRRQRQGLL
jgi:hypothetical protein